MRRYEKLKDEDLIQQIQELDTFVKEQMPLVDKAQRRLRSAQSKLANARRELKQRKTDA